MSLRRDLKRIVVFVILFFLFVAPVGAIELYSFFDNQCKEVIGYLVSEREDVYTILSVDGKFINLHRDDLKGILVYHVINPPLQGIEDHKGGLDKILTLSVQNEGKLDTFSGFPIQFIEDLVLFLSIDGSVRVHKIDSIIKIRPFGGRAISKLGKKVNLSIKSKGYLQACNSGRGGFLRPNRILIDQIKIYQFLSNYKIGYEAFKSFQERTYLYARPKLYTQETRFGLVRQDPIERSASTIFPFMEWSSGKPFRVQSLTQIGSIFNEYGADLDPLAGLKAEVKAHFFHSIFIGNLQALSAGSSLFFNGSLESGYYVDSGLNYSAMVGGDLGPHSLSIAIYYPVYLFGSGEEIREVLAESSSYALRYMYTNKRFRFYGVTSMRDVDTQDPSDDYLRVLGSHFPESYSVKSFFIRSGVDMNFSKDMNLGFNLLFMDLSYTEQPGERTVSMDRLGGVVYTRKNFGEYISFGGRLTFLRERVSGNLTGTKHSRNRNDYIWGWEFGLIF